MFKRFLADETGATAVEYGLIVGVLSLAIVGTLGRLADTLGDNLSFLGGVIDESAEGGE